VDLRDYILPADGLDWVALLAPWDPLLPDELTPWFLNRFGEPLLVFADGSVHLLIPELAKLERLAPSRHALASVIDEGGRAEALLRLSEVDVLVRRGLTLAPGQCYGFSIPLLMHEGRRTVENVRVWDIPLYFAFLADVQRQARDLPDGTKVRLRPRSTRPRRG
jgi:hypothetical protein